MLQPESMCGKGACQWERAESKTVTLCSSKRKVDDKNERLRWHKYRKKQRFGKKSCSRTGGVHSRGKSRHRGLQRTRPHTIILRPINLMGSRAPGMRAPRNTNQFLMHEKYQLMRMRTDSVVTESSGSSDDEFDTLDVDSYLRVLEDARGALLDHTCPVLQSTSCNGIAPSTSTPLQFSLLTEEAVEAQEESLQYFPSEDDVVKTLNFMEKDFNDFFNTLM